MAMNSRTRRMVAKKKAEQAQDDLRAKLIANAEKRLPKDKAALYARMKGEEARKK